MYNKPRHFFFDAIKVYSTRIKWLNPLHLVPRGFERSCGWCSVGFYIKSGYINLIWGWGWLYNHGKVIYNYGTHLCRGIKKNNNKTERRVWYKYIFVQRLKEVGCLFVQSSDHRTPGSHTSRISFRIEANYRFTLKNKKKNSFVCL